MDKLKALLEKTGCKPELAEAVIQTLDEYKTTLREQFEAEYTTKVEQAKKICLEETESHKRELSRRLQIFCETKAVAIDAHLMKQSAIKETAAQAKLRELRATLEGVELNGGQNGQTIVAVEKAKRQIQQLAEDKNRAIEVANRQTAIAERVLKQNRALTTENARLKASRSAPSQRPVSENRNRSNSSARIDGQRRNGSPTTTRPTIVENQDRRAPVGRQNPPTSTPKRVYGVEDVANSMDEDLV